jgi:hypothetical protein
MIELRPFFPSAYYTFIMYYQKPGDAHYIFLSTCKVIMDHATNFIRLPERNEYHAISDEFHLPRSIDKLSETQGNNNNNGLS